uniref:Uncharacterized protein n=1 Tax=Aegilops tauschii subsp. strangulata TaxID=200361 RepID=A0A453HSX6_AEGTS
EMTSVMLIMVPKKGERTTQLLERERKSARQVYQDNQRNMRSIRRGDAILVMIEMTSVMLIMVPKSERTTQLLERERKSARQVYQDNQRNMMSIRRGDPILLMIEMTPVMLIMVPKKGEMITQLPEREWRTTEQNHQDNQTNMMMIRKGDRILPMIEATAPMLIIVRESKPCSFTAAQCECNLATLFQY